MGYLIIEFFIDFIVDLVIFLCDVLKKTFNRVAGVVQIVNLGEIFVIKHGVKPKRKGNNTKLETCC